MKDHRLRAPSTDGALLAVPPLAEIASILPGSAAWQDRWNHDFQGRRAVWLRNHLRCEVVAAASDFLKQHGLDAPAEGPQKGGEPGPPLVVTGHQPELFHPGVWVKNFAAAAIARAHRGLGLNLIVDNDLPKSSSVRVPAVSGDQTRALRIEFDRLKGEQPYEDLMVNDEMLFASFGERVSEVLTGIVADPIIRDYWPDVIRRSKSGFPLGLRLALARRGLEAAWGVSNLEIPLSRLCQSEGFLWFACHLLAHLPRFQELHNQALAEYRALYKIRSKNHPVSALGQAGQWHEAPFWVWRQGQPRRRALLVRQDRHSMLLRIDGEDDPLLELPLSPDREACCAVDRLRELPGRSIRLRTRALTTTMFCRILLGDLFIHGIGGARYDELGDSVAARFFGTQPPPFLTLSMTAWLGMPDQPNAPLELARVNHALRDLRFNPDRHLSEPVDSQTRKLIVAKQEAIAQEGNTRKARIARFHAIREINEQLQRHVKQRFVLLQEQQVDALKGLARNRITRNREYAFVLHSARRLHELMTRLPIAPSQK